MEEERNGEKLIWEILRDTAGRVDMQENVSHERHIGKEKPMFTPILNLSFKPAWE